MNDFQHPTTFRIRRIRAHGEGKRIQVSHADVIAESEKEVKQAYEDNKILNWRKIDRYGEAGGKFERIESISELDYSNRKQFRKASRPGELQPDHQPTSPIT